MPNLSLTQKQPVSVNQLFYVILILHVVLWTISPLLARYTVSHDTIEAFVWGQHLDFGYDKNPFLVGWITYLALKTGFASIFTYYLIQQLFIALGFWSIWKLGNLLFNPQKAFIAVAIHEACLYFSAYAHTNNDNFPLIGLWTLGAYVFFLACRNQSLKYWLLTGATFGVATMAKYSTLVFMSGLFLYLLVDSEARKSFRSMGLYAGILLFLLILLPNIIWLANHDFVAFRYAFFRGNKTEGIHFFGDPAATFNFIKQTSFNLAGSIILFLLTKPRLVPSPEREKTMTHYLWCTAIFPLATVTIAAFILGQKLYWEWGTPFVIFWGLFALSYLKPNPEHRTLRRFFYGVLAAILTTFSGNILVSCYLKTGSGSGDYPARDIAAYATQVWHQRYQQPLPFVAGSRYTAGFVSFYSTDKPLVFVEWNAMFSPGVSEDEVKKQGAIFIQDGNYGTPVFDLPSGYHSANHFPASVLAKYPQLIVLPVKTFQYHRHNAQSKIVTVLIGILPPKG
jgi:hypothetical protein